MWVLRKGLFAREEWIERLRNQVLRPFADASLRIGLCCNLSWALSALIYSGNTIFTALAFLVSYSYISQD